MFFFGLCSSTPRYRSPLFFSICPYIYRAIWCQFRSATCVLVLRFVYGSRHFTIRVVHLLGSNLATTFRSIISFTFARLLISVLRTLSHTLTRHEPFYCRRRPALSFVLESRFPVHMRPLVWLMHHILPLKVDGHVSVLMS